MEVNKLIDELVEVMKDRKEDIMLRPHTSYLFEKDSDKILKKIGEKTSDVIIACKNASKEEQIYEISDLMYNLMVLMMKQNIEIKSIIEELEKKGKKNSNKKSTKSVYPSIH